jgi:hypothetical protein
MNFWDILEISPTADSWAIKKAYARLLRKYNPEEDPKGFMCLREAYESACEMAESEWFKAAAARRRNAARPPGGEAARERRPALREVGPQESAPKPPARETVSRALSDQYDDFAARVSVARWRALFASFSLDEMRAVYAEAVRFFNEHPCLPPAVWRFLDDELELTENPSFRWADLLRGKPDLCGDLAEAFAEEPSYDYAAYAELRLKCYLALRAGAPLEALRHAGEAVGLLPRNTALLLLLTGDSFCALGMPREDAEAYALYLALRPSDDAVRFSLAAALAQAEDCGAALRELKTLEARGYRPDDVRRKIQICMTKIGRPARAGIACKQLFRRLRKSLEKLVRVWLGVIVC